MWRSIWRMESTAILTQLAFLIFAAILGSLGVYFSTPLLGWAAGLAIFLFIYRLRYKRL